MTPSHATKAGKRYRYYIDDPRKDPPPGGRIRLNADEVERAAWNAISAWLADPRSAAADLLDGATCARDIEAIAASLSSLGRDAATPAQPVRMRADIAQSIENVSIDKNATGETTLAIRLAVGAILDDNFDPSKHRTHVEIASPIALMRRGQELRLILGDCETTRPPDPALVDLLARAHRWKTGWFEDPNRELKDIVAEDGGDPTTAHRILRLAFLAPNIVDAILNGRARADLTAESLRRMNELPASWAEQRRMLGF